MKQILDFTQDINVDIEINKNRDLDATLHCVYVDGEGVENNFEFAEYTTALLQVKKSADSDVVALALSTIAGSIQLLPEGRIRFRLKPEEVNVRAGKYVYDLYLFNSTYKKRQFMSGNFIIKDTITN